MVKFVPWILKSTAYLRKCQLQFKLERNSPVLLAINEIKNITLAACGNNEGKVYPFLKRAFPKILKGKQPQKHKQVEEDIMISKPSFYIMYQI